MEINLENKRIYKVLTNGNIIDGKFYDSVIDKENYVKIEYNTLTSNLSDDKPFRKLCRVIANTLNGEKNIIDYIKALSIVFITILLILTLLITVLLTITKGAVGEVSEKLSQYSKDPITITIVIILLLGTSIIGAFEVIQKIDRIKNWLLPKKSDQLIKEINEKDTEFNIDTFFYFDTLNN